MQVRMLIGRVSTVTAVAGFTVVLGATSGASAAGQEHCQGSGRAFGQFHAELARSGELGGDRNPGQHQGYSSCQ